ncbi:uncharacterized protein TNCV_3897441 [Trichonephila clavipes]|nr:uncharacterized protein TNCV_3897441 [Trichonephila clavipes]
MEAGWSARRVARQSGLCDCVVRRCWDQWIQEMSFTRRPRSGCPQQTIRREDRHTGPLCLLESYEGVWQKNIWDHGTLSVCCPGRPPIYTSVWSGAAHEETGLQRN